MSPLHVALHPAPPDDVTLRVTTGPILGSVTAILNNTTPETRNLARGGLLA